MSIEKLESLSSEDRAALQEKPSRRRMGLVAAVGVIGIGAIAAGVDAPGEVRALLEADAEANVRAGARNELFQDGFHVISLDVFYKPEENPTQVLAHVRIDNGCYVDISGAADVQIEQVHDTFSYTVNGIEGEFAHAEEALRAVQAAELCQ